MHRHGVESACASQKSLDTTASKADKNNQARIKQNKGLDSLSDIVIKTEREHVSNLIPCQIPADVLMTMRIVRLTISQPLFPRVG